MKIHKKWRTVLSCMMAAVLTLLLPVLQVNAVTVYVSDGNYYDEGYIFIGESHMQIVAYSMQQDALGNVPGLEGVQYSIYGDHSLATDDDGNPGTHTMSGNLFFVFAGTSRELHNEVIKKEYIYSDGKGKRGGAVEKIHTIIDTNPNIAHWNIISFHGANIALKEGSTGGDYYVESYRNWINYEFPDADCYFLPQSTMTKNFSLYCRGNKDVFNQKLQQAFPDNYIDLMPFFWEHYPQGLRDPNQKSDLVHWSDQTYYEMICLVIRQIQEKRAAENSIPAQETQPEIIAQEMVLYTNDTTVIYEQPDINSTVILPSCEAGLPIQVTGVTSNGYFQIQLGDLTAYVIGSGLN